MPTGTVLMPTLLIIASSPMVNSLSKIAMMLFVSFIFLYPDDCYNFSQVLLPVSLVTVKTMSVKSLSMVKSNLNLAQLLYGLTGPLVRLSLTLVLVVQ